MTFLAASQNPQRTGQGGGKSETPPASVRFGGKAWRLHGVIAPFWGPVQRKGCVRSFWPANWKRPYHPFTDGVLCNLIADFNFSQDGGVRTA